jgi:hypothetical protein
MCAAIHAKKRFALCISDRFDARYKPLVLPNLDSKRSRQEFSRLLDRVFVAVSTDSLTAIDVPGILHEDAVGFFHRCSGSLNPPRKIF